MATKAFKMAPPGMTFIRGLGVPVLSVYCGQFCRQSRDFKGRSREQAPETYTVGVFMGEKKTFSKRDLFSGLAVGLLAAWMPIACSVVLPAVGDEPIHGVLKELGLNLIVLATFILAISVQQRQKHRVGLRERLYTSAGLILASVSLSFVELPFAAGVVLIVFSSLLLMFQFLPIFEDFLNYRHVVATFAFSFPPYILMTLIYRFLLRPTGNRLLTAVFLTLLTVGAFLFYYISRGYPRPPLMKTRIPLNKKQGLAVLYGVALYFTSFVMLLLILQQIETAGGSGVALGVAALLLAVVVFAMSMLAASGNLWYISYTSFVCFGLGLLFYNIGGGVMSYYLPAMLFMAAAGSIIVLFLTYVFHSAQERDNTLWVGLALVMTYMLVTVFVGQMDAEEALFPLLTRGHTTRFMTAFVFILAPTLFKPFAKRVELDVLSVEAHDPSLPAPEPGAEPEGPGGAESPESLELSEDRELTERLYEQLTASERKIYDLLLQGCQNQQIAENLYISQNTVKFHMKNILAKAGVRNRFLLPGYKSGRCMKRCGLDEKNSNES